MIAETGYWERCGGVAARISSRYAGWFLRVADNRFSRQPVYLDFLPLRAGDLKPFVRAATTSIRTVGRIGAGRALRHGC